MFVRKHLALKLLKHSMIPGCLLTQVLVATVAKRKTLFDDRPVEINELTYVIKQDLSSLNSQISSLQSLSKSQQSQAARGGTEQEGEHNKNVGIIKI